MGLPASIALTIMIGYFFLFQKKKFSFLENSIVFMILTIVTTNYITIMSLNLHKFETTKNPFLFIVVPLYRDIMIPLLVLVFTNAFFKTAEKLARILYGLSFLAAVNSLEYFLIFFKIVKYTHWNFLGATIVNLAYLLIGLGLARIVNEVQKRSNAKA